MVTYTRANGQVRRVLAWGAVDAIAPDPNVPQQQFKLDYTGGWGKYHKSDYWRRFKNVCRAYSGPPLVYGVAACTAPDGTHWALQSWQRVQPLRGVAPFLPGQMAWELHLSHWSKPLAELQVSRNWTYDGTLQGLFGRLLYEGKPVHGFKTPTRSRSDRNARYVYIDTFNSAYGPGLEARRRESDAHQQRRLLLQLRPSRPSATGVPERSYRVRRRGASPRDCDGARCDAGRPMGGCGPRPVRPRGRQGLQLALRLAPLRRQRLQARALICTEERG